jgi:hypothetical protein
MLLFSSFFSFHLFGIDLSERKQGQTQIAHLAKQAVQRGLVDHGTANDCWARGTRSP